MDPLLWATLVALAVRLTAPLSVMVVAALGAASLRMDAEDRKHVLLLLDRMTALTAALGSGRRRHGR